MSTPSRRRPPAGRVKPLLSVVVPCRDAARHLPVALASAQRNTDESTEWVLVDDGSTDRTAELLAAFRPAHGTVRVLTNDAPAGVSAARSRGIGEAGGRYLAFLDADDWLAPGHLQAMVAAVRTLDVDFVRCDHQQVAGLDRRLHRVPEARRGRALHARDGIGRRPGVLAAVDAPNLWAGVYHRRLAERGLLHAEPGIRTAEDRMIIWRLHLHADRFAVADLDGYRYRREVAGSLTAIGDERQLHFFDAWDLVARDIEADASAAAFRPKHSAALVRLIAHHEAHRSRFDAAVHRRFRHLARTALRALPAEDLEAAVRALPQARAALVRALT